MTRLSREFYLGDTVETAKALLGCLLVRRLGGETLMARLRFGCPAAEQSAYQRKNFLNGPGKVCQALGLTREQNGLDLTGDVLFVLPAPTPVSPDHIHSGKRIGIDYAEEAVDFPWRFWIH